ncbi:MULTISPECIES: DNA -binding domain-containing protein [unclassified Rhizobium]|uniref:DNA -binding domain-containing protein n=1 Tax=unclassified Rhizobium TaxID=2613769 RepID=UPI0037F87F49
MIEPFEDIAPVGDQLTDYDLKHMKLYMRLLDAAADGVDWREAVQVLFGIDPHLEAKRARRVHDSHLVRARWMSHAGYRHLLRKPTPGSNDPPASG